MPSKLTVGVPKKPEPLIVTLVPTTPEAGVKEVTWGVTWKVALVALPPAVVTTMAPLVAVAGMVTLSEV